MIGVSVRSVDLQVLIPKAPEVQKAKLLEQVVPQNNELINMNKDKRIAEEKLSQVNRKEKPETIRINEEHERERKRQERKKEQESRREQLLSERKKEDASKRKPSTQKKNVKKQENKIDIRI